MVEVFVFIHRGPHILSNIEWKSKLVTSFPIQGFTVDEDTKASKLVNNLKSSSLMQIYHDDKRRYKPQDITEDTTFGKPNI